MKLGQLVEGIDWLENVHVYLHIDVRSVIVTL